MKLKVKRLTETARLPEKAFPTEAGYDVFADDGGAGETAMKLHFYKKTFPPVQNGCLRYYDYHNGIAGYCKEQDLSHYYGYLTFEQLDEKIKIKRADATKRAFSRGRLI